MRILYVDDHLIAIDKPGGLLSVPGRGEAGLDCASARVRSIHADALVVHRLDMSTSGVLLMALGPDMQRALSRAFATREVHKRYVAVVEGSVEPDEGTIDLPIAADWPNRPRQRIDRERGKPSLTRWRVLSRDAAGNTSRLALEPLTGRTHQIRVHLRAIGHPVLGDALYGSSNDPRASRLMLHAHRLDLTHPATSSPLALVAPLPF